MTKITLRLSNMDSGFNAIVPTVNNFTQDDQYGNNKPFTVDSILIDNKKAANADLSKDAITLLPKVPYKFYISISNIIIGHPNSPYKIMPVTKGVYRLFAVLAMVSPTQRIVFALNPVVMSLK